MTLLRIPIYCTTEFELIIMTITTYHLLNTFDCLSDYIKIFNRIYENIFFFLDDVWCMLSINANLSHEFQLI